jgi:ankyrin repeat protein
LAPLHVVARQNNIPMAQLLLKHGANLGEKDDKFSWTPLYTALVCGNFEIAEFFLNSSSPVELVDKNGKAPIHHIVEKGDIPTLKYSKRRRRRKKNFWLTFR